MTTIAENNAALKQPVTLVFDIGKTTKKVLAFDTSFQVLEEITDHFKEINDQDGFPSEDLQVLSSWIKEKTSQFALHPKYEVTHINFSAYGASLVHLDRNDQPILPFYNYLKPFPETCRTEFVSVHDPENNLAITTASPLLGMLNSGLQLFWLKREKPSEFKKITTTLHFPQFLSFLITTTKFSEITSIGSHTMLWDFGSMTYHKWVTKENFISLFPELTTAERTIETVLHSKKVIAGVGVHDSSAALMPYLVAMQQPFLLLSTGTWNITFNPFNHQPLTKHELSRDCLCYLTYNAKPVKASRIFLGHEHEMQQQRIAEHFKVSHDHYRTISFNEKIYNRLNEEQQSSKAFYPLAMEGTGPISEPQKMKTDLYAFENFEEAYHQLIRYLVKWQKISIDLLDPLSEIPAIILVGGFMKNSLFLEIIKRELKDRRIMTSDHPRASALGAAWLVHKPEVYKKFTAQLKISEY